MIEGQLDQGENIFDAIDNLKAMSRGGLEPMRIRYGRIAGKDVSAGKLVKEGYDGLISPLFDRREARLNVATSAGRGARALQPNMQDKQVLKPQRIYEVDLHQVRDAIRGMSPAQQKEMLKVVGNRGNDGRGMSRSRVNVNVPNNTPGIVDITDQGYVAQLARELNYA